MRRADFLTALTGAALVGVSPRAAAAAVPSWMRRVLWLKREGYGEEVRVPFCVDGRTIYDPGYRLICWLLRDHKATLAEGYVRFDIVTIEALWEVQQTLSLHGVSGPIIITSGYRTPETNAATEGAARNSQHLYARAVDMYIGGVSMHELFDACYAREISGGIGYYDSHVHLDSGTRRYWVGRIPMPVSPILA